MTLGKSRPGKRWWLIACLLMLAATGGCKQGPWTLWNSYAARFIDAQGRVIDPQGGDRTTSEGQAYALFFALAGNDRATFDRVLAWTRNNLASGDLETHLPAWLWGKDKDGAWKTLDPNSASDADVWMAYTLVEAGRLWRVPAYTNLGRQMMAQIAKNEVADLPGFGPMLLPGPTGFQHGRFWTLNPSYMPLFLFERLAAEDPAGPWKQIALGIPGMLEAERPSRLCHGLGGLSSRRRLLSRPRAASGQQGFRCRPEAAMTPSASTYGRACWTGSGNTRSRILNAIPGHERLSCQS